MAFTPDEATDNFYLLGKKQVAKVLYTGYCRYRNTLTGRTNVRNEKLAERLGINIAQLSTSKTQLLGEDPEVPLPHPFIVRDPEDLKYGVIPVMGAREFQQRRIWKVKGMSEEELWKFQNSGVLIWNYQAGKLEIPNLRTLSHIIDVPSNKPDISTPSSSSADDAINPPALKNSPKDSRNLPCDEAYVAAMIEAGAYPPHLDPPTVWHVFRELSFECSLREPAEKPTRAEYKGWLRQQRRIVQAPLINTTGAAPLIEPVFGVDREMSSLLARQIEADARLKEVHAMTPLQFYADCTGNTLTAADLRAAEKVLHVEAFRAKAAIALCFARATEPIRHFNFCLEEIEIAASDPALTQEYFYASLVRAVDKIKAMGTNRLDQQQRQAG
jgi:hypothetical protein